MDISVVLDLASGSQDTGVLCYQGICSCSRVEGRGRLVTQEVPGGFL